MRTPARVSREVLSALVGEYIQERKRILRELMREAVIHVHQEEGLPVPEGEEMQAHIGVLSLLLETGNEDADEIGQLFEQLEFPPETGSQPSHKQILTSLKKRLSCRKEGLR